MKKEDKKWQEMTMEIISGMAEWREQHGKATFREIEEETMRRMSELQARIMEEVAEASSAREWEKSEEPKCPNCGAGMERRGKHKRKLQAVGGSEVELERAYAVCPECGTGFFPPR